MQTRALSNSVFLRRAAFALAALLFYSILTLWVRGRWARSLLETGIFLLGIAFAARAALRPLPLRLSWPLVPFGFAAAWGLVQLAARKTAYRYDTWNAALFWAAAFTLFFVSLQVCADARIRRRLLRALLYFGFGLSVLSVVQLYTSPGNVFWIFPSGYKDEVLGPFVYRNNYAAFIELLLPLALWEALRGGHRALAWTVIGAVMYATVIASASRAGSALATLEVVAVLLAAWTRGFVSGRKLGVAALKILTLAAVCVLIVGWENLWRRLAQPDPFIYRREMLASAIAMGKDRPLFGFGLGTFQTAYPAYALFDAGVIVNHAHNDWAEWFAEGGAPMLLMMLSVAAWSVRPALRSVWGIGLLSVFAHALVDYPMQRLGLMVWVIVFLAALAAEAHLPSRREM